MKPIKVLHLINVEKENYYLKNLADYSDPDEVEFSFVTFAGDCDFVRDMTARGRRVFYLDALSRKRYPQAFLTLGKLFKSENPDIVHTHLFDPTLIGLTIAKRQRRRAIFTRHHSDAVYEPGSDAKRKFYLRLEKYINHKADHIIAPSQMVRDILVEKENVAPDKVSLIPYGQTTERFDAVTPEKIEAVCAELGMKKNLALVCTARLFHRKGHKYLFEAFSALTRKGLGATLYLVGTGDDREALEQLARDSGIEERVRFLG